MILYIIPTSVSEDSGFTNYGTIQATSSGPQMSENLESYEFYQDETYSSSSGSSSGSYNSGFSQSYFSGETSLAGSILYLSHISSSYTTNHGIQSSSASFSTSSSNTFSGQAQTTTILSSQIDYTKTSETSFYYNVPTITTYSTSSGTNTSSFPQSSSTTISSSYVDVTAISSSSEGTTIGITYYSYQGSYGTGIGIATVIIPGSDEVLWVITRTGIDILENLAYSTTDAVTLTNFSVITGSIEGDSGGNIISSIYFSSNAYTISNDSQLSGTLSYFTQDSNGDGFGFTSFSLVALQDTFETITNQIINLAQTTTLGTGNLPITGEYQSLIYSTATSIGTLNSYAIQTAIYTTFEDTKTYFVIYNGTINISPGVGSISSIYNGPLGGSSFISNAAKKATLAVGLFNPLAGNPLALLKQPNYGFKILPDQTGVYNEITIGQPWPISLFSSVHVKGDMAPITYPDERTWVDTNSVSWTVSWNSSSVFLTSESGSSTSTVSGSFSTGWTQSVLLSQSFYQEAPYNNLGYFIGSGTYEDSTNPNYIALPQGFYYRSSGVQSVTGSFYSESLSTADFLQTKFGLMVYNGGAGGALFLIDNRATIIGE